MNCLDFRRLIGAEPNSQDPSALEHAAVCPACADFAQRTRALDRKILQALQLPIPETFRQRPMPDDSSAREGEERPPARATGNASQRWMALAASLLVGVGIAAAMWLLFPRATLAADLVAHMSHEPYAWKVTDETVSPEKLKAVLERSELHPNRSPGQVSYAQTCWFRGHFVPHLVVQDGVQDNPGSVTVILLPKETVEREERFAEAGYSGAILPVGQGSVAVLTRDPERIEAAVGKIRALQLLGN